MIARLTDHDEGKGSPPGRAALRLHLAACGTCGRYLRQLRAVKGALAALGGTQVAPATRARLLDTFRDWHAGRTPS